MRTAMSLTLWTALAGPIFAGVEWRESYGAAYRESARAGKPMLLFCTTDGCAPCARMRGVLDRAAGNVNSQCVPVRLHSASDGDLLSELRVGVFPTLILAAPDGTILRKIEGAIEAPQLVDELARASPPVFGVTWQSSGRERSVVNGREVTREALISAMGSLNIPDDADKPFLTLIGEESERDAALASLNSLPELREAVRVQSYAPDDWAVACYGFVTGGTLNVSVEDTSGKVLYRSLAWHPSDVLAAVRRAHPNYDPRLDPSGGGNPPLVLLGLLAVGAGLIVYRRSQ